jgi:sigma-B regulation protein RsbU (phosphoserine phosphatase)
VGVLVPGEFEEIPFEFAEGDRFFVFSDGVYDTTNANGEEFGEDRFIDFLATHGGGDTASLLEKLSVVLSDFCQSDGPDDDMSLFVAERT